MNLGKLLASAGKKRQKLPVTQSGPRNKRFKRTCEKGTDGSVVWKSTGRTGVLPLNEVDTSTRTSELYFKVQSHKRGLTVMEAFKPSPYDRRFASKKEEPVPRLAFL